MTRHEAGFALVIALLAVACVDNSAPGNDREASLDAPNQAAEMLTVDSALDGVSTELLYPETLTDADLRSIPDRGGRCVFRYTRVGLPVFLFASDTGVIKLNHKLLRLPAAGDGFYRAGSVTVAYRKLDDAQDGLFPAELVLRLRDAPNELGFHGFTECPVPGRGDTSDER